MTITRECAILPEAQAKKPSRNSLSTVSSIALKHSLRSRETSELEPDNEERRAAMANDAQMRLMLKHLSFDRTDAELSEDLVIAR